MDNELEEVKKQVSSIRNDVDLLKIKLDGFGEMIKNSINEALASQLEKINQKILDEFDKKDLERLRRKEEENEGYKRDAKKTVVQWVVTGILTIILAGVIMVLNSKNDDQQKLIEQYYNKIVELEQNGGGE